MSSNSDQDILQKFLEAVRVISTHTEPHDAAASVITETCRLLQCDRASLYYLDEFNKELVLMMAKGKQIKRSFQPHLQLTCACACVGAKTIRLPVGAGITGHVAASGETVNVPDAYAGNGHYSAAPLLSVLFSVGRPSLSRCCCCVVTDPRFNQEYDRQTGYKVLAWWRLPFVSTGQLGPYLGPI